MGDYNLDLLKMDGNQHIKDFTNMMFSSTFYPLISRPTRVTNSSATQIDNIFVNKIEEHYKCGILFTDLSDHLPVFLTSSNLQRLRRHNDINIKYRIINDTTVNKLCQDLECEDWNDIYNKTDVQDAYDHFYKKLLHVFNKNMPLLKPRRKINKDGNKVPWITKGTLKSRKTKNMLYKKFIKNPNERNESTYKIYRNKFNEVKNLAKKYHYNKEFNEHKGNLRLYGS